MLTDYVLIFNTPLHSIHFVFGLGSLILVGLHIMSRLVYHWLSYFRMSLVPICYKFYVIYIVVP
jgi:hypothetical protein